MHANIAALCCAVGIVGLFWLNREKTGRPSWAEWPAVVWLSIAGSRAVGRWLQPGAVANTDAAYMDGSSIDRTILSLLLAVGLVVLANRGRRVGAMLWANPAVVGYFLYCGVSILWSDYPIVGLKRWFRGIGDLVMVLVILTERNPGAAFQRIFARVGFLLLPTSIVLIKYFPAFGRDYHHSSGLVMYTGVSTQKNNLGETCVIYGLIAAWRLLIMWRGGDGGRRKGPLIAQGAALAMATYLLWLSNSKTSLSCLILAGGLMAAVSTSAFARKPAVLHLLVFLLVAIPSAVLFLGVGGGALESLGRDETLTGRTDIWRVALKYDDNPLIGAGYETFWLGSRLSAFAGEIGVAFNQAHNGYLEIYLNLGWVGVTLIGVLIATGYRNIVGRVRQDPVACSLALAYFVVAIVYNFTEAGFKMMASVWIAFLLVIMADSHHRSHSTRFKKNTDSFQNDQPAVAH